VVDTSRRSYTYETRLLKYAKRGFAVFDQRLERARVAQDLSRKKCHQVTDLARLLLLEQLYMDQQPKKHFHTGQRYCDEISREGLEDQFRGDASIKGQVSDFELGNPSRLRVEDYVSILVRGVIAIVICF
jgi:hypothetical protein